MAYSTIEAEFIAYYEASNKGIWLQNFIIGLNIVDGIERPLKINCDNKAVALYFKNNISSSKSKHINIMFLVVKERVQTLYIDIEHISTTSWLRIRLLRVYHLKCFMSIWLVHVRLL